MKVKSTQSLVASPTIDSDEDEEIESDADTDGGFELVQDEPELPAADVVSSAKQFLSVLMASLDSVSERTHRRRHRTSARARARKVPAMACRAHNLLAHALLRTACQKYSADKQRARKQTSEAQKKGKDKGNDSEHKQKDKVERTGKTKGKVSGKRQAMNKDNQKLSKNDERKGREDGKHSMSREATTPASLFRLLLTNGDSGVTSLLTEVWACVNSVVDQTVFIESACIFRLF